MKIILVMLINNLIKKIYNNKKKNGENKNNHHCRFNILRTSQIQQSSPCTFTVCYLRHCDYKVRCPQSASSSIVQLYLSSSFIYRLHSIASRNPYGEACGCCTLPNGGPEAAVINVFNRLICPKQGERPRITAACSSASYPAHDFSQLLFCYTHIILSLSFSVGFASLISSIYYDHLLHYHRSLFTIIIIHVFIFTSLPQLFPFPLLSSFHSFPFPLVSLPTPVILYFVDVGKCRIKYCHCFIIIIIIINQEKIPE